MIGKITCKSTVPPRNPRLIIDANNLAFRAFATTGGLSHADVPTGTTFGFLKQIKSLRDSFLTDQLAFCFDCPPSKRQEISPAYKGNRKKLDDEAAVKYLEYRNELVRLCETVLPDMGFRNVFWQTGYEADDVIASVVQNSLGDGEAVIVSSDHDLYQLLGFRVSMWLPHKKELYREADLLRDHGVLPSNWPDVLALAGCPGDGVVGMRGVGIKTAAKFMQGKLPAKATDRIGPGVAAFLLSNLPLVRLPFPGTKAFRLREDECTPAKARAVFKRLGFRSLMETW